MKMRAGPIIQGLPTTAVRCGHVPRSEIQKKIIPDSELSTAERTFHKHDHATLAPVDQGYVRGSGTALTVDGWFKETSPMWPGQGMAFPRRAHN